MLRILGEARFVCLHKIRYCILAFCYIIVYTFPLRKTTTVSDASMHEKFHSRF